MAKELIIVESPTKAKTISRFLGKQYNIQASFGHLRDLPKSKMGIDIEHNFQPQYVVPKTNQKTVAKLKELAAKSDTIYFATDEDREGEAIAWHLLEAFKEAKGAKKLTPTELDKKVKRIVFHEITEEAIKDALEEPRDIDDNLVDAQQARRILDRLVGYELSPFLWKKVARGLSAGRVQSVAVRLIVEQEREIEAFKPEEYWSIEGEFAKQRDETSPFPAKLTKVNGTSLDKMAIKNKGQAQEIMDKLDKATYSIADIQRKETKKNPPTPFTTSTLQQEGNRKLGFSARQTMYLAQQLYEGVDLGEGSVGLITYMRTDSMNLAQKFLNEARAYIGTSYGNKYQLDKPRVFKKKSKLAQEAHEAIRPTDVTRTPESIAKKLDPKQLKLYTLIWQRTVACQMPAAVMDNVSVYINEQTNTYTFRAGGSTVKFDGFMRVYNTVKETILPPLKKGEDMDAKNIEPLQHFTEPPARYSEAGLVRALEEREIGRPSTYAPTIATIIERRYVEKDNKRLAPTEIGTLVNDVLVEHFPTIVDYEFTAHLEDSLDEIAQGDKEWVPVIRDFYEPFKKNLDKKQEEVHKKDLTEEASDEVCEKCGKSMVIKIGRFGKFLACTGYPDCKNTIDLNKDGTKNNQPDARELGEHPEEKKPIYLKVGRFGAYLQLGAKEKGKKPRTASLLPGMEAGTLTLEQAIKLFELPRTVGTAKDGEEIKAANGRYGPYIKAGSETRSLPDDISPLEITEKQARDLLAQPKGKGRKRGKQALKELGKDPDGNAIKIMNGRYGPYVTDGKVNASIPRGQNPHSITLDEAVSLISDKRDK